MGNVLTNYNFLSPLKRPRAVRNRSNNATRTSSNRLPVLTELSTEQESFLSLSSPKFSSFSSSSTSLPIRPNRKRLSRYGKAAFTYGGLDDDFLTNAPRSAPRPPPTTSTKTMPQNAHLSEFDIIIDIPPSEPSPPICESSISSSTSSRQHDSTLRSPHPTRSPTPSLTSMSACSSTETPITPGASDDECLYLQPPPKSIVSPPISFHPLAITRSIPSPSNPDASPVEIFEFTLAPLSPFPETEAEEEEEEQVDEDDVSWYMRELSPFVSVSSSRDPSSTSPARPDSLLPPPRFPSSNASRPAPHSRMSKPLPAIPRSSHPSPEMDPTFPRRKSRRALPSLPLTSQFPSPPSTIPPVPSTRRVSARRSLTITVPSALPHVPHVLDVSDILDEPTAWSFIPPSGRGNLSGGSNATMQQLSPPRVPQSPSPSTFSEYDPIELIFSEVGSDSADDDCGGKARDEWEEKKVVEVDDWAVDEKLRSRWSCSTLATLVPPPVSSPPPPPPSSSSPSASARIRFHIGSVARRVRVRRPGGSGEDATMMRSLHLRTTSESAIVS
ncbi:hypothetical protein BGW80DRAFT_1399028 [Lactifluus volemus]|nr:hypothetical protein BGW80DRAFT_1399028 [Lactifluus volemus]